jgi:predicted porin
MVFGNAGPFRYAAAVMNSAPASWPYDWQLRSTDYRIPSVYLRASAAVDVSTTVGVSFARGPYEKWNDYWIPPGHVATDFNQTVWGVDAAYSAGHLELFAEGIWSRFQTAFANTLELYSYYAEAKYTFLPGFYAALRLGQIRFGTMTDASGESVHWDRDTTRYELGSGWFFTKNFFVKASYQINQKLGGDLPLENMLMLELVLAY